MTYGISDVFTLLGSLGLFLYGMKVMSDALIEVAGDKMRSILASLTSNRFLAVLTGFIITAIIQSSSATSLMVISFVNASLLTLFEAIGVILGSHIGTTVTAWLITLIGFKIHLSAMALPLMGIGFLLSFSKKKQNSQWGYFIIGFAILFLGLQFLNEAVPDIKENPEILEFLTNYTDLGFWSILIFLGIGTLLTVIIQSSSAAMAITLIMCYQGWIPFELAAAMVLGLNVGTTITANLGAIVANTNAKRAARSHFITQGVGVLIMLFLLHPTLMLIDKYIDFNEGSPFSTPASMPLALSIFHSVFNILNVLLLVGFIKQIENLVIKMVPERIKPEPDFDKPKFLTNSAMRYPQTAVRALLDETKRLFEGPVFEITLHTLNLHREDLKSNLNIKKVISASRNQIAIDIDKIYYLKIKGIYSEIIGFATNIQANFTLLPERTTSINNIKIANRYIVEIIKDSRSVQPNLDKYLNSNNAEIRLEYDKMRKRVSKIYRKILVASVEENPKKHKEALEKMLKKYRKNDVIEDGTLDALINENKITRNMATSVVNDSATIANICKNLIRISLLLYVESDSIMKLLEEDDENFATTPVLE
jgi:phosphate:Na+ symporter